MKKYFLFIILLIGSIYLTGCQNKNEMYSIKKIDPYLYEINYDDYRYDTNLETAVDVEAYACSSVKNGDFYGRNFDFIFNDVPEYIVKIKGNDTRHASIGMSILSFVHENDDIMSEYMEKLELLPNMMLDGINDAGVVSSCNVVPKNDVIPVTGTNINGEYLHMTFVVRYVLDNASSADEAIELLKNRNIYGNAGENYNLHIMIADKDKTYVVEFIDNKMVYDEKKDDEQIMTNYYVNLDDLTENSAGVERYQILKENYSDGNSFEGMWNLMQKVKFSNAYLINKDDEWYSDAFPQSIINSIKTNDDNEYIEKFNDLKRDYWEARNNNLRNPSNMSYWFTTHNSIYDIASRKLRITIQENYDKYYEYKIG